MTTLFGHHAEGTFTYPRDERLASARSDVHAAWLAMGRAIFGGMFVFSSIHHFMDTATMTGYAASKGVPYPEVAVLGSGMLILLGGLSLILGAWPRAGASMIVLFLLVVTPVMHDFWNAPDQQARMGEFANFLKNVGLLGGAGIALAIPEPWPGSVHMPAKTKAAA